MPTLTPGRKLIRLLNKQLPRDAEWTESERVMLDLIADSTDRADQLKKLMAVELAKPEATRRGVELAAEIRQTEATIAKWIALLDPTMTRGRDKSRQHQQAAWTRWHGSA